MLVSWQALLKLENNRSKEYIMELSFIGLVILSFSLGVRFGAVIGFGSFGVGLIAVNIIRHVLQIIINQQKIRKLEAERAPKN